MSGLLSYVDVLTDGFEDVALVFHFDSSDQFSVTLCDTDVAIGHDLEVFTSDPNEIRPVMRCRLDT